MPVVKLTTPWNVDYAAQTPGGKGVWKDFHFRINDNCQEADYWLVWGGIKGKLETCKVPDGNLIYITDEAHEKRIFSQGFINQFDAVLTPRQDLHHRRLIFMQEPAPWYLKKTRDELEQLQKPIGKPMLLSIVTSSLLYLDGHVKRFAFANQMIGHFKGRLDAFGRGIRPVDDKFDALYPYKYSIALENSALRGYITEKLQECYLCYTMPLYWGAPDVGNYFDPDSMVQLDITDMEGSIEKIEWAIRDNLWNKRLDIISAMRERVLEKTHIIPLLVSTLETHFKIVGNKNEKKTHSEEIINKREYHPLKVAARKLLRK